MNHRLLFPLLLCLLTASATLAQDQLKGHVKTATGGRPIADVYLMLMSADGKRILAYDYSDHDGAFALSLPQGGGAEFIIATSRLGYEAVRRSVHADGREVELKLRESSVKLREVKVEAAPIRRRGDTLNYFMSSFARPQDKTLAEVLARMPGIEVRSDGQVKYDGRPINRFYIEDMNLLGNRYSLATKNLSPTDIAAVQVYENHEPVKMLRGRTDPDEAALNIKLKDRARALPGATKRCSFPRPTTPGATSPWSCAFTPWAPPSSTPPPWRARPTDSRRSP